MATPDTTVTLTPLVGRLARDLHRTALEFESLGLTIDGGHDDLAAAILGELRRISSKLLTLTQSPDRPTGRGLPLTPREAEVLAALAEGGSTARVAASLGISVSTVRSHVKGILAKLGVHSRVEAVAVWWGQRPHTARAG